MGVGAARPLAVWLICRWARACWVWSHSRDASETRGLVVGVGHALWMVAKICAISQAVAAARWSASLPVKVRVLSRQLRLLAWGVSWLLREAVALLMPAIAVSTTLSTLATVRIHAKSFGGDVI